MQHRPVAIPVRSSAHLRAGSGQEAHIDFNRCTSPRSQAFTPRKTNKMLKKRHLSKSNRRAYWIPVLSLVRQTGMTSQGRVTMTEQAELRDHPRPCHTLVMPWLDHGTHADATRHGNACPFGKAKECIAGSSPAMTGSVGDKEWGYLSAAVTAEAPLKVTRRRTALPSWQGLRHRVLPLHRAPRTRPQPGAG